MTREWEDIIQEDDMVMEFKVPQGKPPFIGIRFRSYYAATRTYNEIVDEYKGKKFYMILSVTNLDVSVKVLMDESPSKIWKYYNVKCDLKKLQLFLAIQTSHYNFAHIFRNRQSKDEVAKTLPLGNLFSIRINRITLHGEDYVR